MDIKVSFGKALKKVRKAKKLTQEDFSDVSSRTYLSTLERGMKSITLEKLNEIAGVLDVHPLTVLVMAYEIYGDDLTSDELLEFVQKEVEKYSIDL